MRILLVEDSASSRIASTMLLEMRGHRVDNAVCGRAAVSMVQTTPYDVVLMDVRMPGMDGLEATRCIRALPGLAWRTVIVAITGNVSRQEQEECRAAGMDDFLGKPFTQAALETMIHRYADEQAPHADSAVPRDRPLACELGDDGARAVLASFATEGLTRMKAMMALHHREEWDQLGLQAQALYDASDSLGFAKVAAVAQQMACAPITQMWPTLLSELSLLMPQGAC